MLICVELCSKRRRLTFHAFRVGFVSVGVLEEDAVAAADGGLAVTKRIPGKPDARSRVEQMSLRATGIGHCRPTALGNPGKVYGTARAAAVHQTKERIADSRDRGSCIAGNRSHLPIQLGAFADARRYRPPDPSYRRGDNGRGRCRTG